MTDAVESLLSVHQGAPIYVVGHSMGAAVATLCALDLLFTFQLDAHRVRLYTYGSPRVGNDAFAAFVARTLPVRTCSRLHANHTQDMAACWLCSLDLLFTIVVVVHHTCCSSYASGGVWASVCVQSSCQDPASERCAVHCHRALVACMCMILHGSAA